MVGFIIGTVISLAIIFGAYFFVKKQGATSFLSEKDSLVANIQALQDTLKEAVSYKNNYISKAQYEFITDNIDKLKNELEKQQKELQELEEKLKNIQKLVEEKEKHQQELKASKEEDEEKLEMLLETYNEIYDESMSLEQQIGESMKVLDSLVAELNLNEEQRALVDDFSESLSLTGETLRNLLIEYQSVNERLKLIQEQHQELEEEYTKLVEQQLGE